MLEGGDVTQLGEQLARAADLEEATAIVRAAVRALGLTACEIVRRGMPRSERRTGIDVPVLGPQGVVATLSCGGKARITRARERQLVIIAMYLSVWWTNRRIDGPPHCGSLTPRQLQIAQFAASGRTNAQIATVLGISVNTVKARLKEVFDRLRVNNRTELANVLRRDERQDLASAVRAR
jgi:DNA-binding CsgD family transcriptional regulator